MSEHPNSIPTLSPFFTFLVFFLTFPATSLQTLVAHPYFGSQNLLVASQPFKLSKRTSFSSDLAFAFSPNSTETLALLLSSRKLPPFSKPGSEKFALSREDTVVSVEFDADENNVGVCVGGSDPSAVRDLGSVGLVLDGGEKLRSWIDYDASSKRLEVRLQKLDKGRPYEPIIAHSVDLVSLWGVGADLILGISSFSKSSSKNSDNAIRSGGISVSVFSWKVRVREFPFSMHSMPVDPTRFSRDPDMVHRRIYWVLGIVFGCVALAACLMYLVWKMMANRKSEPGTDFRYEKVDVIVGKDGASCEN